MPVASGTDWGAAQENFATPLLIARVLLSVFSKCRSVALEENGMSDSVSSLCPVLCENPISVHQSCCLSHTILSADQTWPPPPPEAHPPAWRPAHCPGGPPTQLWTVFLLLSQNRYIQNTLLSLFCWLGSHSSLRINLSLSFSKKPLLSTQKLCGYSIVFSKKGNLA